MSEPINSVDFKAIHFPEGGPSNGPGSDSQHHPSSAKASVEVNFSDLKGTSSACDQASAVQTRLTAAGASVRVGVETVNGNTVFTIRDSQTGQIIRKIPSDEAIRISQNIDRLTGVYLDRLE